MRWDDWVLTRVPDVSFHCREMSAEEATNAIVNDHLPQIKREMDAGRLSVDNVDVFCEKNIFTVVQTRRILEKGKEFGMAGNFHAEELSYTGGAEVFSHCKFWTECLFIIVEPFPPPPISWLVTGPNFFWNVPFSEARNPNRIESNRIESNCTRTTLFVASVLNWSENSCTVHSHNRNPITWQVNLWVMGGGLRLYLKFEWNWMSLTDILNNIMAWEI